MLHLLTLNPLLSFTTSGKQTGSKLQTEFSFPGFSVLPLGFFSLPAVLFAESMSKSIFYLFIFFWLHQVARGDLSSWIRDRTRAPCTCGILTTGPSEFLFSMLPSSPASQESFSSFLFFSLREAPQMS